MKPKISVVITDLDNTLFDWVEIWGRSFTALVDELVRLSGVDREVLLDEIAQIHQSHGTSEYAFLVEELPSLRAMHPDGDLAAIYDSAIHAHRSARKKSERLYPGVLATLKALKEQGVKVVGYTESMAYYASRRVRVLKLDGLLDLLYSPPDHDLPRNLTPEQVRKYPPGYYDLAITEHRHTPKGELKPNPGILLKIIEEIGATPEQCLYVGDNLMKDVAMANDAGVLGVHAEYGKAQHLEVYNLLRRVTHWSPGQVQQEKTVIEQKSISAKFVLEGSFAELLALFDFAPFGAQKVEANIKEYIDIWKKIVDVQQHFNDIEMRIRALAITALAAMLGASAYAHKEGIGITIWGHWHRASFVITIIALVIWFVFYCLDRHWYHRLLYGSVDAGAGLEKAIRQVVPELDLGGSISRHSPVTIDLWLVSFRLRSTGKMDLIYGLVALMLIVTAIVFY